MILLFHFPGSCRDDFAIIDAGNVSTHVASKDSEFTRRRNCIFRCRGKAKLLKSKWIRTFNLRGGVKRGKENKEEGR